MYIRVKDENIIADNILVKLWKREKDKNNINITFSKEEKLLLKCLNDRKKLNFDDFLEISQLKKKEAEDILVNYILIGMVKINMSDKTISFSYNDLA